MIKPEDTYKIGQISKTHGLKGEVVLNFTDDIFDRVDCPYLLCNVEGILVPFFIEEYRFKSDSSALLKFEDIDSIEAALQIIESDVYFEKKYIEETEQESISLSYFIGFTITNNNGNLIGKIINIDDNTDNLLFIIERKDTKDGKSEEILIPAHKEFITEINHKKKNIEMDLPDGLLDL